MYLTIHNKILFMFWKKKNCVLLMQIVNVFPYIPCPFPFSLCHITTIFSSWCTKPTWAHTLIWVLTDSQFDSLEYYKPPVLRYWYKNNTLKWHIFRRQKNQKSETARTWREKHRETNYYLTYGRYVIPPRTWLRLITITDLWLLQIKHKKVSRITETRRRGIQE